MCWKKLAKDQWIWARVPGRFNSVKLKIANPFPFKRIESLVNRIRLVAS